jgi:hypothetical protein
MMDASTSDGATDTGVPVEGGTDSGGMTDSGNCGTIASSATVTGTLLGTTLTAKDAIATVTGSSHFIIIGDFAGICSLKDMELKASSNLLVFDYFAAAFPVGMKSTGPMLNVQYAFYDAMCGSPKGESASSGSVTITKSDGCVVEGTFDVTLNNDHVTGSFKAPWCAMASGSGCK